MSLFKPDPRITVADRERLTPFLSNDHNLRAYLRSDPKLDDLKRCVLIEIERGDVLRRPILAKLLLRIRDTQHSELERRVIRYMNDR